MQLWRRVNDGVGPNHSQPGGAQGGCRGRPSGEQVNLALDNAGQVFHDLAIEGLDVRLAADPGTIATGGLQVDQPGEYGFICTVPGHAAAGMRGTLNVQDR